MAQAVSSTKTSAEELMLQRGSDPASGPPSAPLRLTASEISRNRALLEEGLAIVEEASAEGIDARLLGGVAVLQHCGSLRERGGSRVIADLDIIVGSGQGGALAKVLARRGYEAEVRFNALHGQQRMLFHGPVGQLDVLVGAFQMCHKLDLSSRLALDYPTVTVTDLLLTKLQIVQLNEKDSLDALAVLSEHDVTEDEGDCVNARYLASLASGDWGLWRTITITLQRLREMIVGAAPSDPRMNRINAIQLALTAVPKSLRFKVRARIGERVPWYLLPDEAR